MIDTAVILAAGNGSRLRGVSKGLPKPLVPLAGVPIIVRVITNAQKAGVKKFVIVTGYQAERMEDAIRNSSAIDAEVQFVRNPEYREKANGVSALMASEAVDGPFALLMADHIFEPETLRRLLRQSLDDGECMLAVDRKIPDVFDLDDATKVIVEDDRVREIDKQLEDFNAVDTGMFICRPSLFDSLRSAVEERGDASLSDAIRDLAHKGLMRTFDIGDAVWQDVDTPRMRREAERRLGQALRKPTDGPVSRLINRRVSIPTSMLLIKARVSPNQISFFNLMLGLVTGALLASTSYWMIALGGLFIQLGSILDGCDGEVARLTHRQSPYGEWIDTFTDNLSYVAILVGIIVGQFRREPNMTTVVVGAIAVAAILIALLVMYQRIRSMGKGSLLAFDIPTEALEGSKTGAMFRFYDALRPLIRRDVFSLGFMLLALANLPGVMFLLWAAGSVCMLGAVLHITSESVQRRISVATAMVREA